MTLGLITLILSSFLIFKLNKKFLSKNIIDEINDRSSHKTKATRSGGIAVFSSLFIISCFNYFNSIEIFDYSFLIPISLMLVVGLYDDIYKLDFKLKFIFQIIAAKIIIDNGLIIDNFHGFMGVYELSRIVAQIITIFAVVGIINAINFIDGIDGLAISIAILFFSFFEFFAKYQTSFSSLSFIIIFSLIPLYYFNYKKKNKVFLGDSGSLFLGTLISIFVLNILSDEYLIKNRFDLNKIIFVISILFYPFIDLVRVLFIRLKNGKSPFIADRNHIHHLILEKTKSHFYTVVIIIAASILLIISIQYFKSWI